MSQEILSEILQLDHLFQLSQNHCKNINKCVNLENLSIVQLNFINLPNIFAWFCFPQGGPEARENILPRFPPSPPHI